MFTKKFFRNTAAAGLTALACWGGDVSAQVPVLPPSLPSPHMTLWRFLGIPQGQQRLWDATANARGNRPGAERIPPLKRLADPENLLSDNPAIKKAAEVKQQEDLKQQKIKAIKYLGTIACGCYKGVKEALLAALDDCTEEVRYEAAKALVEAAGNKCKTCNSESCCSKEVLEKLTKVAFDRDDAGCFKEASARVREMALKGIKACTKTAPPDAYPIDAVVTPVTPNPVDPVKPNVPGGEGIKKDDLPPTPDGEKKTEGEIKATQAPIRSQQAGPSIGEQPPLGEQARVDAPVEVKTSSKRTLFGGLSKLMAGPALATEAPKLQPVPQAAATPEEDRAAAIRTVMTPRVGSPETLAPAPAVRPQPVAARPQVEVRTETPTGRAPLVSGPVARLPRSAAPAAVAPTTRPVSAETVRPVSAAPVVRSQPSNGPRPVVGGPVAPRTARPATGNVSPVSAQTVE